MTATIPIQLFSVASAAELLSVSEVTIRRYIKSGDLRHHRIGDRILLSYEDIQSFMDLCVVPKKEANK